MDRLDDRITRRLAIGLFAVYGLLTSGRLHSIDGIVMFQAAKRLLFHGAWTFDPPLQYNVGAVVTVPMQGMGLTLAYIGLLLLWSPAKPWVPSLATIPHDPSVPIHLGHYYSIGYLLCGWLNGALTAITAALVYGIIRILGFDPRWGLAGAALYGLASPAVAYARFDFNQPLTAFAVTLAVATLISGPLTMPRAALTGVALGAAVLTRIEFVVVLPVVLLWLCRINPDDARIRPPWPRLAMLAAPVGATLLLALLANVLRWGADRPLGYQPSLFGGPWTEIPIRLVGLVVSPGRGLLAFFPVAVFAVTGWRRLAGAGQLCAMISMAILLLYSSYRIWWGGWSWGPRFLIPILPLVVVGVAAGVEPWMRRRGWCVVLLVALGILILPTAFVNQDVHFAWLDLHGYPVESTATQFRWAASPLAGLWLHDTQNDLLWVESWRPTSTLVRVLDTTGDPLWELFAPRRRLMTLASIVTLLSVAGWGLSGAWRASFGAARLPAG